MRNLLVKNRSLEGGGLLDVVVSLAGGGLLDVVVTLAGGGLLEVVDSPGLAEIRAGTKE
jgi:hypothetical protein